MNQVFEVDSLTLKSLEWDKIQVWFESYLESDSTKKVIQEISFTSDPFEIENRQSQTEAGKILNQVDPSFRVRIGMRELKEPFLFIQLLKKGSVLSPSAFIELRRIADSTMEAKLVISGATSHEGSIEESGFQHESLLPIQDLVEKLPDVAKVARSINRVVEEWTPEGEEETIHADNRENITARVKDGASSSLSNLRSLEKKLKKQIKDKLKKIMEQSNRDGKLQDKWMDIRSGRYVIPIKDEFQNQIDGSVMESSVSGATVYLEPTEVMELTNQLKRVQVQIEDEVQRILAQLSNTIKPYCGDLANCHDGLMTLDFWIGRGAFATEAQLSRPRLSSQPIVELEDCYHPLLQKSIATGGKCIKNSFSFTQDHQGVLLSGPNSGGKTVLLKAVGLSQLFLAFGHHIPAKAGSRIYPFKSMFCDLGDHQSIEDNLSSFGARIKSLKNILERASEGSLILIDEILSATDPDEASALAQAVIEDLILKKAKMVLTTHFEKLKQFAATQTSLMNGSMEFDQRTLSPTFKYKSGTPGRSMALEIAARFGVPNRLIDRAKSLLGESYNDSNDLLSTLNLQLEALEGQKQVLLSKMQEAETSKKAYESELASFKQKRDGLYQDEKDKILELVQATQEEIKSVFKKTSKGSAQKKLAEVQSEFLKSGGENETKDEQKEQSLPGVPFPKDRDIPIPSRCYVVPLGKELDLIEIDRRKGIGTCSQGVLRITYPLDDIRVLESASQLNQQKVVSVDSTVSSKKDQPFSLDLRGFRVDEALYELEQFIDSHIVNGTSEIKVIHGHGEGALKEAVRECLNRRGDVSSFSPAHPKEGGDGVTKIKLD